MGSPNFPITLKLTRPAYQRFGFTVAANPHFNYHALTTVANNNYDPSYGLPNANIAASIQAEEAYNKTTAAFDASHTAFTTTYRSNGPSGTLPTCQHN